MDVAVLICGMLREFSLAQRSWNFKGRDCFLVTWDRTSDDCRELGYAGEDPVGITPSMRFCRGVQIVPSEPQDPPLHRRVRTPYLWRIAERMLRSHEMARGKVYDRVLVIRPDCLLGGDIDLEYRLATNEILAVSPASDWVGAAPGLKFVQDFYWLISRDKLSRLCAFDAYWPRVGSQDIHDGFARYFEEIGWTPVQQKPFIPSTVVRRNARDLIWTSREEVFVVADELARQWSVANYGPPPGENSSK